MYAGLVERHSRVHCFRCPRPVLQPKRTAHFFSHSDWCRSSRSGVGTLAGPCINTVACNFHFRPYRLWLPWAGFWLAHFFGLATVNMPLHIDALHRILANRSETALLESVLQHWAVIANDNVLYHSRSRLT